MQETTQTRLRTCGWLVAALAVVTLVALWTAHHTDADLLAHSPFDSYTTQAMAWREGRIALDGDYPWLELAIFEGDYYVSFPPVPAIPMWLLSFFVGEATPSGLLTLLYLLGSVAALYFLGRRYLSDGQSALMAGFVALGGSVLDLAVSGGQFSGGVWFQAQLLGLLFTSLAFLLVDGKRKGGWAAGLICIALAVGCRPFNALYVPVLLWMMLRNLRKATPSKTLLAMLPYIAIPALIAAAYGIYNYVRFGNPLEFGHAYLPELEQAGEGMFVLSRLPENIGNIFRPMTLVQGALTFPFLSGFAVYLTNPMLWIGGARTIESAVRKRADLTDLLLGITVLAHALLLLMHRTNGGWQYGTRYLCDLLPALAFLALRSGISVRRWEAVAMGALTAINVYGTIVFHWL